MSTLIDYFYREGSEVTGPFPGFSGAWQAVAAIVIDHEGSNEIETVLKGLNHWEVWYQGKNTGYELLSRGAIEAEEMKE